MLEQKRSVKLMSLLIALACFVTVLLPINVKDVFAEDCVVVTPQATDERPIPDKSSTGCKGTLVPFVDKCDSKQGIMELTSKHDGQDTPVMIKRSDVKDKQGNIIDHTYNFSFMNKHNNALRGEYVFENIDFTGFKIQCLQEELVTENVTLTFKNCRFSYFKRTYEGDTELYCNFFNCQIVQFSGLNSRFYNCSFGGSVDDPLHPFKNVEVYDSYFYDLNHKSTSGTHIDATQIFGGRSTGQTSENIIFKNCRFEVPYIYIDGSSAYVNACVMLQLEYGDGENIRVEDCYLNGGGYTIYSQCANDLKMKDVLFKNVHVGAAHLFSAVYPNIDKNAVFEDLNATDSLYVTSVYKQNGKVNFYVSNDTDHERKLLVVTDKGDFEFTIKAGPNAETLKAKKFQKLSDLPIDILETIEADCSYIVCFDVTDPNITKQIRFVNFTDKQVTLDPKYYHYDNTGVLLEGNCGIGGSDKVKFTLSSDYVVTVYGNGEMGAAPWMEYKDLIRKVVIKEGVINVGGNAFKDCFNLRTVVLEKGVTRLDKGCFWGCTTLEKVYVASAPTSVAETAFNSVPRDIVNNYGTLSEVPADTIPVYPTISVEPTPTSGEPTPTSASTASIVEPDDEDPTVTGKPSGTDPKDPTAPADTEVDSRAQIEAFVKRLYNDVLGREAEADGLKFWSDELYCYRRTGAYVALEFILSDEFLSKNMTDDAFVKILYKTYFGREAEAEGLSYWKNELASGRKDRTTVAIDFIYSQEWADTCASYGILSGGDLKPSKTIKPTSLTYAFVERMYTVAMGRTYDKEGREYWASVLANYEITGEQVGAAFFLSDEMIGFKLSDTEFLARLYSTFMNREADADGAAYWLEVLGSGTSRADVVYGFTRSPEFTEKCIEARILPY